MYEKHQWYEEKKDFNRSPAEIYQSESCRRIEQRREKQQNKLKAKCFLSEASGWRCSEENPESDL